MAGGDSSDGVTSPRAGDLQYIQYGQDKENEYLGAIRQLISQDLSEPYSIYVYRYFLYQWGDLCYMVCKIGICTNYATDDGGEQAVDTTGALKGVIICKLEIHRGGPLRGYIAMLAVKDDHRGKGIATRLVRMAVDAMIAKDADEVRTLLDSPNDNCIDERSDRFGNRDRQYPIAQAIRTSGILAYEASIQILPQREHCVSLGALSQGRNGVEAYAATCISRRRL